MAPGERARRLGAHARLACGVCGARARAVPSDRRALPARTRALGAHQVTNTSQAGAHIAADAPGRAATRRGPANTGESRRPSSSARGAPPRRTRHEGDYSYSS